MEEAGAFSVEAEVICDRVMGEISRRTSLITSSLGSRPDADIIYLFQNDICGEQPERPRHARSFGDIHSLVERARQERRDAPAAFRAAVEASEYPAFGETAPVADDAFEAFQKQISVAD